jgi:acyl-CoA reductase-like NAD-dependent aldehyde dehydrogenase
MQMRVGGRAVDAAGGGRIAVLNPATGEVIDEVPAGTAGDIDRAVEAATAAGDAWGRMDPRGRGKILGEAARRIREQQDDLALALTREQGKPLHEARNEVQGCANVLEYYHSISGSLRGESMPLASYGYALVRREPVGVCGAIVPWNMPLLIMAWKIGPALCAGNTVVLKPASSTPLSTLAVAAIMESAGLPPGVLNVVTGSGTDAGAALAGHPALGHLSFTGDAATGAEVAARAGRHATPLTLELGGSDAMIVCADADLGAAAAGAVRNRFYNCGQTCTAVKRLIVDESVYTPFMELLKGRVAGIVTGPGTLKDVAMGPLNSADGRDRIATAVRETEENGEGRVVIGGGVPRTPECATGWFFEPTLMADVAPSAPVWRDEVFGPVLPLMRAASFDDAVAIANASEYGLGASVWTRDLDIAFQAAESLQAGVVWVNQHLRLPPDVPFGGVKKSGVGRENGADALEQYTRTKTILISR